MSRTSRLFGRMLQQANLFGHQFTISPHGQITDRNGTDGDATQLQHLVSDPRQQPADFAVATFLEDNQQVGSLL